MLAKIGFVGFSLAVAFHIVYTLVVIVLPILAGNNDEVMGFTYPMVVLPVAFLTTCVSAVGLALGCELWRQRGTKGSAEPDSSQDSNANHPLRKQD